MKAFHQLFISQQANLAQAIRTINQGATQITLVINSDERLVGTITDGDIRRALLRGGSLETPVEQIMFRNFCSLPASATAQEALYLMRRILYIIFLS